MNNSSITPVQNHTAGALKRKADRTRLVLQSATVLWYGFYGYFHPSDQIHDQKTQEAFVSENSYAVLLKIAPSRKAKKLELP